MKYLRIFEDYSSDVELVDIRTINKIPKGDTHHDKYNLEYFNKLKEDIRKNGIQDPICIWYYYKDNALSLGEGHHRLKIANELNIEKIPIRIMVSWRGNVQMNNCDYDSETIIYHPPKKLDADGYAKRNYYPTNIKASELGLF